MKTNTTIFIFLLGLVIVVFIAFQNPVNNTVKLPRSFGPILQWSGDSLNKDVIQLGRVIFYDKRISVNNTVSCASCHKQEFAFSDNSIFSKGVNGMTSRNSMALSNLLWQEKFFWDGRVNTLEKQSIIPIQNPVEMGQHLDSLTIKLAAISLYRKLFKKAFGSDEITAEKIAQALTQFQKTIISSQSKFDQYLTGDTTVLNTNEKKGYKLFITIPDYTSNKRGAGCVSCHSSAALQMGYSFQNNGLDSVSKDKGVGAISHSHLDNGKFKVPSLRNIAFTAPYMHDGRFKSLEEVVDHYNNGVKAPPSLAPFMKMKNAPNAKGLGLTKEEIRDLIAFLHTLSDDQLLTRKDLSDPFQK